MIDEIGSTQPTKLDAFDEAHLVHVDAQDQFSKMAQRRAGIVTQIQMAGRLRSEIQDRAFKFCAASEFGAFEKNAARIHTIGAEKTLLERALQWVDAFPLADAERAVLVAHLDEACARVGAERERKAFHDAAVIAGLNAVATVAGGLPVEGLGTVSSDLENLVHAAETDVRECRKALTNFDAETRAARIEYEKEHRQ
jgi:hypothetical protein